MNAPARLLITGSSGVVGATLAKRLRALGHHVDGFDRHPSAGTTQDGAVFVGDLAAYPGLEKVTADYDGVIHLAGCSRVGQARRDPLGAVQSNIVGTAALLDAIRRSERRPWLLMASTSEVKVDAAGGYKSANLYGVTKAVGEMLGRSYALEYGMVVAAARMTGVYGDPGDYPDKVPAVFMHKSLAGAALSVARTSAPMDYVHIDDVCAAFAHAVDALAELSGPAFVDFDIRSGEQADLRRLAEKVVAITGGESEMTFFDPPPERELSTLSLTPPPARVRLEEGLKRAIADIMDKNVGAPPAAGSG